MLPMMKILLLTILLLPLISLRSVEPAGAAPVRLERFEFSELHMGTNARILFYANDAGVAGIAKSAARAAFDRIARLDAVCSDYRNDSDLTMFCEQSGNGPQRIDADLYRILALSQQWSERTGGLFDVTMAPVVQLWRRARRTKALPDPERLARARELVGYQHLHLEPADGSARLDLQGMRLDLGGIAKGFAADEALAVLARAGIPRALVAVGGDIAVGEPPPGSSGWPVGVAPLDRPDSSPTLFLSLRHSSVSTSGDAEQSVFIDGKRYSHIVDPRTGIGVTRHSSVTVVASRGATSDALATTLSILGPDDGLPLLDSLSRADRKLAALFVEADQRVESKRWQSTLRRKDAN